MKTPTPFHVEWLDRLDKILGRGHPVGPRGKRTLELMGSTLFLGDLRNNLLDVPDRKLNFKYAVAEWLWMMYGRSDVESIAQYNAKLREFSDDGRTFTGAYGPHVGAQYPRVLAMLTRDPATRQAVIEIPRPWNQLETRDMPCTLSFQFLIRKQKLHCITTMRSSDSWLGLPYDVFTFTQLASCLAGSLGVATGSFLLQAGSAHLYETDFDAVRDILFKGHYRDMGTISSPALPGRPPAWLEDVLLSPLQVPDLRLEYLEEPWKTYARVLAAPVASAREILCSLAGAQASL